MTEDARLRCLLTAIATAERVESALRRYSEPDDAIEQLACDVGAQRLQLVQELRSLGAKRVAARRRGFTSAAFPPGGGARAHVRPLRQAAP